MSIESEHPITERLIIPFDQTAAIGIDGYCFTSIESENAINTIGTMRTETMARTAGMLLTTSKISRTPRGITLQRSSHQ